MSIGIISPQGIGFVKGAAGSFQVFLIYPGYCQVIPGIAVGTVAPDYCLVLLLCSLIIGLGKSLVGLLHQLFCLVLLSDNSSG